MPQKDELSSRQKFLSLLVRCVLILTLVWVSSAIITSAWMEQVTGIELIQGRGFNTSPIQWLGLLLFLFVLVEHKTVQAKDLRFPTNKEFNWGLWLFALTMGLGVFITHLPLQFHDGIRVFMVSNPPYGGALVGSIMQTASILTFLPVTLIIFPEQLKNIRWYALYIIGIGLVFMSVLESLYWSFFSPLLTRMSAWMTGLIMDNTYFDIPSHYLGVDTFAVYIGPSCSGIGSLLLFLFLFAYILHALHKNGYKIILTRSIIVLIGGIFFMFCLNAFRIASIMLVGTWDPDFAVGLFHSSAGGILFFFAFLLLLPILRNWVCVNKK